MTVAATVVGVGAVGLTAGYLLARYHSLPDLLVVHFARTGFPNGFQFKTWGRVFVPVFVQLALLVTLGPIAALLLSRPRTGTDAASVSDSETADMRAAAAAAEAVALLASIWIVVQAFAAFSLARMWERQISRLDWYGAVETIAFVLTIVVAVRAHFRLGRPEPRPFVPEHWRYGQLYKNPHDPALFVPTRNGARWTLNFGRPVAAALMGVVLVIGIVAPAVILALSLR